MSQSHQVLQLIGQTTTFFLCLFSLTAKLTIDGRFGTFFKILIKATSVLTLAWVILEVLKVQY